MLSFVSGPPLESPLPSATHLICAFDNTPKAKEVRRSGGGRGAIVGKEWLKECARRKRRLPEADFAPGAPDPKRHKP